MIDDIRAKIHLVTDTIYGEFVATNPYASPKRVSRAEYPSAVADLTRATLSDLPSSYTPEVAGVSCLILPIGTPSPMGPLHSPIQPISCASNTVGAGIRCARCAFLPNTLCSNPFRHYVTHGFSPHVGRSNARNAPSFGCLVFHCSLSGGVTCDCD